MYAQGGGKLRNVTINHASCVATLGALLDISGNLTITAGELNTNSGSNYAVTVAGDCYVAGTLTGNASAISLGSLEVAASGKYNATSGTTTITAEDSVTGFAWDVNGTDSFDNNDGTVLFDLGSGVDTHVRTGQSDGANSFHHLTVLLNASTNTLTMRPNAGTVMTVEGDLTVQEGVFQKNTHSHTLTVTGHVSIESGGKIDATSASGAMNMKSLEIASGGTYEATSGTTTLTGEHTSGFVWYNLGTFNDNDGTVTIGDGSTSIGTTHIRENRFHHLIINRDASSTNTIWRDVSGDTLTIDGDLTITKGFFYRHTVTDTLTVTGDVTVEANGNLGLTADTGANNFGSLTINSGGTYNATSGTTTILGSSGGFALLDEGTFTHNSGTVKIDFETSNLNSSTRIHQNGAKKLNNVEIEMNRTTDEVTWSVASGTSQGIAGNLTLTKGESYLYSLAHDFDVDGDFLVDANGTWGSLGHSGAHEYGGLKLNSGSTFMATSGTTTITNRFTGTSNVWKNDGGTFTHNNGTVKFTDNDHSLVKEAGSFYNFEQASSLGDYALLWETGGGGSCTILNNLTITRGDFEIHAATDTLDIFGQTIINGSSNSGARFNNDKNQTATITHHGLVTIIQGTYHVEDGATVNMAGIRNVGGLVD